MTFYKSCIIYVICSLLIGNFCYGSTGNKAYKIIVIGDVNVGKASLITQLMKKEDESEYVQTLPSANNIYEYKHTDNMKYNFEIWDTASKTQYKNTSAIFYKKANGIMAVYDITNTSSFNNLKTLIDEALKITGAGTPMIIAANKSDQYEHTNITKDEGTELAKKYDNAELAETTSYDHENVVEAFGRLFEKVIATGAEEQPYAEKPIRQPIGHKGKKKKKTCSCCPCRKKKKLGDEDEKQEITVNEDLLGT